MVERLRLTVLAERRGLSFLIEIEEPGISLLLDTGRSPEVVLRNADILGVDLRGIRAIVLSHGHHDHTNGLVGVLERVGKRVPVVAHPKAFGVKLSLRPHFRYNGCRFKIPEIEAAGGVMVLARNPVTLAKGVMTTGEVERITPYEKVEGYWTIEGEGFVEDSLPDDQGMIVKVGGRGLVIASGCAHSGIVNTIRQAQKVTGVDRVYAVAGGFHLSGAGDTRIQSTVNDLIEIGPELVCPCHCTGLKAIRRLIVAFGDRCRPLREGDTVDL